MSETDVTSMQVMTLPMQLTALHPDLEKNVKSFRWSAIHASPAAATAERLPSTAGGVPSRATAAGRGGAPTTANAAAADAAGAAAADGAAARAGRETETAGGAAATA